jgi:hypothetical protein
MTHSATFTDFCRVSWISWTDKPLIAINGAVLKEAQAMTLRITLSHFASCMSERGLGKMLMAKPCGRLERARSRSSARWQ